MTLEEPYDIGTPGVPWGKEEKTTWLNRQAIQRSYRQLVVQRIEAVQKLYVDLVAVEQYGALSYNVDKYPLFAIRSKDFASSKPTILITGGVHGYETSGVLGALRFVESHLAAYTERYNFIVAPCISPWGFETINRWNPATLDPNRSFFINSETDEASAVMAYVNGLKQPILAHIDLHETTDTDNSEFRPALAARDAIEQKNWNIPDGFYAVGDTSRPMPALQKAIIESVERVTHIAPADDDGRLIGDKLEQHGVINYAKRELGLCAGFTDALYVSTTEAYPDSPAVDDENCIVAQVAAITGALDFIETDNS